MFDAREPQPVSAHDVTMSKWTQMYPTLTTLVVTQMVSLSQLDRISDLLPSVVRYVKDCPSLSSTASTCNVLLRLVLLRGGVKITHRLLPNTRLPGFLWKFPSKGVHLELCEGEQQHDPFSIDSILPSACSRIYNAAGVETLTVVGNCLDLAGMGALFAALPGLTDVRMRMRMRLAAWDPHSIRGLRALRALDVDFIGDIGEADWRRWNDGLVAALTECKTLRSLRLMGLPVITVVGDSPAPALIAALPKMPWLRHLEELVLEGFTGMHALPVALAQMSGLRALRLESIRCHVGSDTALTDALSKLTGLTQLRIRACDGVFSIGRALACMPALRDLGLADTSAIGSELADAFKQCTTGLRSLALVAVRFREELDIVPNCGGGLVLAYLKSLRSLESLKLHHVRPGGRGTWQSLALGRSLETLTALKALEMHGCVDVDCMASIAPSLTNLTSIDVRFIESPATETEWAELAHALGHLTRLEWGDRTGDRVCAGRQPQVKFLM